MRLLIVVIRGSETQGCWCHISRCSILSILQQQVLYYKLRIMTDVVKIAGVSHRLCCTVDKTSDVWDQSMLWWPEHLSLDRRLIDDTECSWECLSTAKQSFLPRVIDRRIQDKLAEFRASAHSLLGGSGFWIDVKSVGISSRPYWIDGSPMTGSFTRVLHRVPTRKLCYRKDDRAMRAI